MNEPTETPLVDLLRIVPIDAVGKWDTGPFATSSTPYGSLCHRAADEIQRLNAAAPAGEPAAPIAKPTLRLAAERLLNEVHLFAETSQFADDIALVARHALSTALAAPAGEPHEIERLRVFALAIMEAWPDVGIDGADLQELGIKHGLLELKMPKPTEPCGESCNCAFYFDPNDWIEGIECYRLTALVTAPCATDPAPAPLKAANLSAALRAIVRECRGAATWGGGPLAIPGPDRPYSSDSYLPPHLLDLAVAALESTETQEHETPLQVIEAMRRDDIERAPSYEELRERREKRP